MKRRLLTILICILLMTMTACVYLPELNATLFPLIAEGKRTDRDKTNYVDLHGEFELPLHGATGFTTIATPLRAAADEQAEARDILSPGTAFTIIEEVDLWWKIETDTNSGYVLHAYSFINVPDILPSIIYKNTNGYASVMRSAGKSIPNITGQKLYDTYHFNERLGKEEFTVPLLYQMAKKVATAQQAARREGDTLVIYEGYRPYEVQRAVVDNVTELTESDPQVRAEVSKDPWSISWFISQGISYHQRGYAIDVTLASIEETSRKTTGDYVYETVTAYEIYEMPSPIHELSKRSVSATYPFASRSKTAWRDVPLSASMNEAAIALRAYCTDAGLTPIASEWWHFNDLDCGPIVDESGNTGQFEVAENKSRTPQ